MLTGQKFRLTQGANCRAKQLMNEFLSVQNIVNLQHHID